jgi:hypothetical protein
MSEPQVTIRMPRSAWRQIESDLENFYEDELVNTEVGADIVVTEESA